MKRVSLSRYLVIKTISMFAWIFIWLAQSSREISRYFYEIAQEMYSRCPDER